MSSLKLETLHREFYYNGRYFRTPPCPQGLKTSWL
jgi:hypothetical protein